MDTHLSRLAPTDRRACGALGVVLLTIALLLGGCAGNSDSLRESNSSAGAGDRGGEVAADSNDPMSANKLASRDGLSSSVNGNFEKAVSQTGPEPTAQRAIISTGQVRMSAQDVAKARSEVQKLIEEYDAEVAKEQSDTWAKQEDGTAPLGWVTLTIRVPSDSFQELMTKLEGVATLRSSSQSAKDVTTQVIDTEVRVRAAEKSLKRMEQLLAQAKTLGEVIRIESELSMRQAELDSLKQTQAWLKEQTSLSTIKVSIDRDGEGSNAPANRFVQAVKDSIRAMGDSAAAIVIFAGAILPWLLMLAVLLAPLLWWRRRRQAQAKGSATTTGAPPGSTAPSVDGD